VRTTFALWVCLALVACTSSEDQLSARDGATEYGKQALPDDALVAAIPDGFELDRIVRNDLEFDRKGWVTVGVRLIPDELAYARVIFYVLPTEAKAMSLYKDQSGRMRSGQRDPGGSDPLPVEGIEPSVCGGGLSGLWTCHATAERFYLVTQSGDYHPKAELDPEGRRYGEKLLRSFATLMR
jgi:hypothetical protein